MITRGVTIWIFRALTVLGLSAWYFGSFFVAISNTYNLWTIAGVIGLIGLVGTLMTGKPTTVYSPEYSSVFREVGWDVEVAGAVLGKIPSHALNVSGLAEQQFKPLYRAQQVSTPDVWFVIGNVLTPVTTTEGSGILSQAQPVIIGLTRMTKSLPGWATIRPLQRLEKRLQHEVSVESREFNRLFDVHGTSARMVFQILPPDLMSWLLDNPLRPWVAIEANFISVTIPRLITAAEVTILVEQIKHIRLSIEKSGILEQSSST